MKNRSRKRTIRKPLSLFLFLMLGARAGAQGKPETGWPTYSNDPGGTRYSPASQIDGSNVSQLKVAWTYRTGALPHDPADLDKKAAFEATPILVAARLFLSTPRDPLIALDA